MKKEFMTKVTFTKEEINALRVVRGIACDLAEMDVDADIDGRVAFIQGYGEGNTMTLYNFQTLACILEDLETIMDEKTIQIIVKQGLTKTAPIW